MLALDENAIQCQMWFKVLMPRVAEVHGMVRILCGETRSVSKGTWNQ